MNQPVDLPRTHAQAASADAELPPVLPSRIPLHVNARGLALGVIATVSFVWALQWARDFLVPLLLGILITYMLSPLVCWLERLRVPRVIGVTLVTAAIVGGSVLVVDKLQGQFQSIVDELPTAGHKLSRLLSEHLHSGGPSALQRIQDVATELQQATAATAAERRAARRAAAAAPPSAFPVMDWIWAGSMGVAGFLSQATMVIFLVFFLLLSGDTFKRKLVKLTGPSLSKKKITVHILEDINISIQKYMLMLLVTNAALALLMWVALRWIGLENAGAWAIVAGLLHLMPYFGPLLIMLATGVVAFLQFESLQMSLLVMGASLAVATLIGTVVTTWMTGRFARMNAAAVFVSLLFWGWLWGVWGLLLGVPVIVIVKVVAERVEGMEVLAELLGE
ncbi:MULTISPECIES: AI-2E family transporter [unclassified Duganella]|jgi:predicted PurR-regulated permease PerM|uniref:AI-2E family transporter n=1 Tax=unclassified Duganella TaxID=2636909 RepID=UPI000891D7AC|nr:MULTISPECIES: AI-2E family transporter [unclassified Duganella]SDH55261.1 Predicted PurR-regulated permease PerM [Duganella sp. OV458]SDK67865.1 Predicted PurR-regulated permease PerM [Duganella sp. OV510]